MSSRDQIREMVQGGMSNAAIAEVIRRNRSYVAAVRKPISLPSETGRPSNFQGNTIWSQSDDRYLLHAFRHGVPCRQIGDKLGKTKNAVIGRLDRLRKKQSAPVG